MAAAVFAVVAASAVVTPPPAQACSIASPGPSEEELLDQADLVFEGVAVSRHDPNAGAPLMSSGDPILWTFVVDREMKGSASQPQVVVSARGSATCGIAFTIGNRYLVLARLVDGAYRTGLGSGTREVTGQATTTTTLPPATDPPGPTTPGPARPTTSGRLVLTG